MSVRQAKTTVNESTGDQESTFGNPCSNLAANENLVIVKTLRRCLYEKNGWKMGNIVDTVENRIQSASLTAIVCNSLPKIELENRSINVSY